MTDDSDRIEARPTKQRRDSILFIAMVSAAALILLLFAAAFVGRGARNVQGMLRPFEDKPFDAAIWRLKSSSSRQDLERAAMLRDLLASHDFKGWKRTEVETLLGPPDEVDVDNDWLETPDDWDLLYNAGFEWADYRTLVFDLDDQDKVISYREAFY